MRHSLLTLKAQNKADVTFTSDSIAKVLVDYFDSHGTTNERMQAHYLLGRAYSDMGEAPRAVSSYQDAIDSADTTAMGELGFRRVKYNGQRGYIVVPRTADEIQSAQLMMACEAEAVDSGQQGQ